MAYQDNFMADYNRIQAGTPIDPSQSSTNAFDHLWDPIKSKFTLEHAKNREESMPSWLVQQLLHKNAIVAPMSATIAGMKGAAQGEDPSQIAARALFHLNPFETTGDWSADEYSENVGKEFQKYWNPQTEEEYKYGPTFWNLLGAAVTGEKPEFTEGSMRQKEDIKVEKEEAEEKALVAQNKLEQKQSRSYERQRDAIKDMSLAMLNWNKGKNEPFRFNLLGV